MQLTVVFGKNATHDLRAGLLAPVLEGFPAGLLYDDGNDDALLKAIARALASDHNIVVTAKAETAGEAQRMIGSLADAYDPTYVEAPLRTTW